MTARSAPLAGPNRPPLIIAVTIIGENDNGRRKVTNRNSIGDQALVLSKHILKDPPQKERQKKKPSVVMVTSKIISIIITVRNCFLDTPIAIKYLQIMRGDCIT